MNIRIIIDDGLKQNGFDGLLNPGQCGCIIGDISPADCICSDCEGGYRHTHSKTGDWIISPVKDKPTDDEIQQCIDDCN